MSTNRINWNVDSRQLRTFGLAALVVFGALAGWVIWRNSIFAIRLTPVVAKSVAATVGVLAIYCGAMAVAAPRAVRPVYIGLSVAGWPIGCIVSQVLLGAIFYGVVTPIGLIMRLVGRDSMGRRFDAGAQSYWIPRKPGTRMRRYFRQY